MDVKFLSQITEGEKNTWAKYLGISFFKSWSFGALENTQDIYLYEMLY